MIVTLAKQFGVFEGFNTPCWEWRHLDRVSAGTPALDVLSDLDDTSPVFRGWP